MKLTINRYAVQVVVFTLALMAVAGVVVTKAHADEFSGFQGSIEGGIAPYTRDVLNHDKPFWCNQYKLLRKQCSVKAISPNKRVAIVYRAGDHRCPGGLWGVVDRHNGDAMTVAADKGILTVKQMCTDRYRVGFVKPTQRNVLASIALYYDNKVVQVFDYEE